MNKRFLLIVAVALALDGSAWERPPSAAPRRAGVPAATRPLAPEFSLVDLSGRKVDLAAYRGRVVLLDFWATWCAPCRSEIPRFVELQDKYRWRGFQIIGVSLDDDVEDVRAFHRQFKMNYPVVLGDAALAKRYGGILGLPVAFLIGCDGRIASRYDGEVEFASIEREMKALLKRTDCGRR